MGIFNFLKPDVEKLKKNRDVEGLIQALESNDGDVLELSIKALVEIGEPATEPLFHAVADNDNNIRRGAAEALGRISGEGVAILRGGLVQVVNSRVTEITGYGERSLVGKQFVNFVSPKFREKVLNRYKKRISYEWAPSKYEIELISKDGANIPVEIKASLIEHGGRPADLVIMKTIVLQKMKE
jgi:PAS domain S-box-containing protein